MVCDYSRHLRPARTDTMPQTRGRIFDEFANLMTNAAGVANGVKREAETAVRSQVERILATMNVVTREEFEAAREMAALAREENEELRRRIAILEARQAGPAATAVV